MRIIGLTGGIACGKSTISLTLKSLGATIIDGDQLSRALTQPGGLALPRFAQNSAARFSTRTARLTAARWVALSSPATSAVMRWMT